MNSTEELENVYRMAKLNGSSPCFISNGIDYYKKIIEMESLSKAVTKINEIDNLIVSDREIVHIYASKRVLTSKDKKTLKKIYETEEEVTEDFYSDGVQEIKDKIDLFKESCKEYTKFVNHFSKIKTPNYETSELINMKHFTMKDRRGKKLKSNSIVKYFNMFKVSKQIQIIILCNMDGSLVYKTDKNFPIRNIDRILNCEFKENCIYCFYEHMKTKYYDVKKTVMNFTDETCVVEIQVKMNDDTLYFLEKMISGIITLESGRNSNFVSGEIDVKGTSSIPYYDFYNFVLNNKYANKILFVNERIQPWCSKKKYFKILLFNPLSSIVMRKNSNITEYPYVSFKISSKGSSSCSVRFKTNNIEMINEAQIFFSKVISIFFGNINYAVLNNYKDFFTSTVLKQFKKRAGKLVESIRTESSGSSTYTSVCVGDKKPTVIEDDEIEDYESFGRKVLVYNFGGKNYNFVCLSDENPSVELKTSDIALKSGNTKYPCCGTSESTRRVTEVSANSKTRMVSSIKNFGGKSKIESSDISDFVKYLYSKNMNCETFLVGTCFPKGDNHNSLNNSVIGALVIATCENVEDPIYDMPKTSEEFDIICQDVRERLVRLPYELYAQEFYDISYEKFTEDTLNPDVEIDPNRYVAGLEALFNVNIFVFCSRVEKRKNPSTIEESLTDTPTLEIPRCNQYYTKRLDKDKPSVLIFKNYGSDRAKKIDASNELICVIPDNNNGEKKCSFIHEDFQNRLFSYFRRVCNPIFFDLRDRNFAAYSDIYSSWNPNTIGFGEVVGQELNIYGKTELLIYEEWNVCVPGIQPLLIGKIPKSHQDRPNFPKYSKYNKTYERAPLKKFRKCKTLFTNKITFEDVDGFWIEFMGIEKGLKILCNMGISEEYEETIYSDEIEEQLQDENNMSCLLQIINWLWKSESNSFEHLPSFQNWISDKIQLIEDSEVEKPTVFMNNLYLPELDSFESRIQFCNQIWPFFFSESKINLTERLRIKILNLMEVQDKHSRVLIFTDEFYEVPKFISKLHVTEKDFKTYDCMIFTKEEHLRNWIIFTNRRNVSHISLLNMNMVNRKIYQNMSSYTNPFFFENSYGKIYMIQNISSVKQGKEIALYVANSWRLIKVNHGSSCTDTLNSSDINYVIFKSDSQNNVTPSVLKSENINYLSIFSYQDGKYAAMLEML